MKHRTLSERKTTTTNNNNKTEKSAIYAWLKRNIVVHCLIWCEQDEVKHSTSTLSEQKRQLHLNATL